jgi:hypothetical protein
VTRPGIDISQLTAFDVHVHLEHQGELTETEKAAAKHFKAGGAPRDWAAQAEYYRSRRIGCVVFTVDESLTGRPFATNDQVAQFAAENSDIAIAFCSINPHRGAAGVEEAKRLVAAGAVRGLKLHPPVQEFFPNDRLAYPLYEVFAEAKLPVLFHTGHSGIGTGMPGGGGIRLKYGHPMPIDDVAVDFPGMPLAGRSDLHLHAQAPGLHRSVRLVPEVLLSEPGAVRQHRPQAQGAVRVRLPLDHARQVDDGLCDDRDQGGGPPVDPEAERGSALRPLAFDGGPPLGRG